MGRIQGGVFDPNGYLYLTSDDKSVGGIYVFMIRGGNAFSIRWIDPNGYRPGFPYKEEMEGLTWWDLDKESGVHSSIEGGQLHWMLLDQDIGTDSIYFKHVRLTY